MTITAPAVLHGPLHVVVQVMKSMSGDVDESQVVGSVPDESLQIRLSQHN
jgi:hypothetical protein